MIETEDQSEIAVLKMSHGKVNAMSLEFINCLRTELTRLSVNDDVRYVVLAGNDRVFSAGVDLKRVVDEGNTYLDDFLPALSGLFLDVFEFTKPLIAAVTGHAVAGGCVLACAADYRVISNRARIGVPELRVGVPFPSSGMEIMRWAATPQAFRRIINTGATFTGEHAVAVGLADETVEKDGVIDAAAKAIEPFAVVPVEVFRVTKRQMRAPVMDRIQRSEELFSDRINALWRDDRTREAVTAYVNERLR